MRLMQLVLTSLAIIASATALSAADEISSGHSVGKAHAEHEHIGLANPGPTVEDPSEFKSDLALWTFVVFLLLLAVLWKFAWGPIEAALEKREQIIHEHLAAAERSHEEAKAMLAEYERKLASAADEVRAMLEEARRDAEHTKQQILVEAKAGADAERARALRDVEAATDAALKQIGERGANLAVELAGKIVGAKLSAADHSRLISEAVTKFPTTSPSNN
jgi:F-type H+-transporting ATPase subunit b